ncbi:MAG: sucrase ferredoxin, partial [Actinomycetota bacterium]|nr:sucrase ferredoxin [Actinomycetota bacterium]
VRVLLIRRHRQRGQEGVRVFAAHAHPAQPWLETTHLDNHHDVLDLDLEALGAGRSPGLTPHSDPVFCVCTHGRHDTCCAELGRPLAEALSRSHPDQAWEISHLGGDRFAGNLLVLPSGLGYGRVTPDAVGDLAEAHLAGRITPEHLRGRSAFSMPVQVAELVVRRELDEWRIDALRLAAPPDASGDRWHTRFVSDDGQVLEVTVRRSTSPEPQSLTCSATRSSAFPSYQAGPVRVVSDSSGALPPVVPYS